MSVKYKDNGKVRPGTSHKVPEKKYRYSSTLSLTSVLMWVSGSRHAPGRFTPKKKSGTHCISGWVGPPGPIWTAKSVLFAERDIKLQVTSRSNWRKKTGVIKTLVTGLSLRSQRFDSRPQYVESEVDKVAPEHDFLRILRFLPASNSPPLLPPPCTTSSATDAI